MQTPVSLELLKVFWQVFGVRLKSLSMFLQLIRWSHLLNLCIECLWLTLFGGDPLRLLVHPK